MAIFSAAPAQGSTRLLARWVGLTWIWSARPRRCCRRPASRRRPGRPGGRWCRPPPPSPRPRRRRRRPRPGRCRAGPAVGGRWRTRYRRPGGPPAPSAEPGCKQAEGGGRPGQRRPASEGPRPARRSADHHRQVQPAAGAAGEVDRQPAREVGTLRRSSGQPATPSGPATSISQPCTAVTTLSRSSRPTPIKATWPPGLAPETTRVSSPAVSVAISKTTAARSSAAPQRREGGRRPASKSIQLASFVRLSRLHPSESPAQEVLWRRSQG